MRHTEKPRSCQAYQKVKERTKARSAAVTPAGQDIGGLPPIADRAHRSRADRDFRFFCETYFPHPFTLAWSRDHLRVIAKIERIVRERQFIRRGAGAARGYSGNLAASPVIAKGGGFALVAQPPRRYHCDS